MNKIYLLPSMIVFSTMAVQLSYAYDFPSAEKSIFASSSENKFMESLSDEIQRLYEQSKKSVVFISIKKDPSNSSRAVIDPYQYYHDDESGEELSGQLKPGGVGSGFIIDQSQGYVLTNNHVINDAEYVTIQFYDENTCAAELKGSDSNTDIAVLKIDKACSLENYPPIYLGNSETVRVGHLVVGIGAPFGLAASLSLGVVSAEGRGTLQITQLGDFLQTDAAINPGNSGGPLINSKGEVIGINTAIFSRSGGYNGIGFSIPINIAKHVSRALIETGEFNRSYVGISLQNLDEDLKTILKYPKTEGGVLIRHVLKNSPADKAGLQPGQIIQSIDSQPVNTVNQAAKIISLKEISKEVSFKIYKSSKSFVKKVTTERPPQPKPKKKIKNLGLKTSKIKEGILVKGVKKSSPAYFWGLKPGDIILELNHNPVKSPEAIEKTKGKNLLKIRREQEYYFLPINRQD